MAGWVVVCGQVRLLVGGLVQVGQHKITPARFQEMLQVSQPDRQAPPSLPACLLGVCLVMVVLLLNVVVTWVVGGGVIRPRIGWWAPRRRPPTASTFTA